MGDPHPKIAAILGFTTGPGADFSPWLTSTLGVVYGRYSSWAHAILIDISAWVALQRRNVVWDVFWGGQASAIEDNGCGCRSSG